MEEETISELDRGVPLPACPLGGDVSRPGVPRRRPREPLPEIVVRWLLHSVVLRYGYSYSLLHRAIMHSG
jgi:hypothetical protein